MEDAPSSDIWNDKLIGWVTAVVVLVALLLAFVIFVAVIIAQGRISIDDQPAWHTDGILPTFTLMESNSRFFIGYFDHSIWFRDNESYPTNYYIAIKNLPFTPQQFQLTDHDLVVVDTAFNIWSRNILLSDSSMVFPCTPWYFGYGGLSSLAPWQISTWFAASLPNGKKLVFTKPFAQPRAPYEPSQDLNEQELKLIKFPEPKPNK